MSLKLQHAHAKSFCPTNKTDESFPCFRTYKIGCDAQIRISRSKKKKKLVVTEVNLTHNHPCNQFTFQGYPENRRLSEASLQKVDEYQKAKVIPSVIRPLVRENKDDSSKLILGRDISNVQ